MNWLNDTVTALYAATRMIMHDRAGLQDVNNTASGFWHSFSAIILIAPLYLFISSIVWDPNNSQAAIAFSTPLHLIALALQWLVWPLVMVFATRWAGISQYFARYVIVYNWSNVLIITVLSVPAVLFRIGLLPLEVAALFTGIIQLLVFYIEWYLARLSLDTSGVIAAAVVLGNFVLSIGILRLIG